MYKFRVHRKYGGRHLLETCCSCSRHLHVEIVVIIMLNIKLYTNEEALKE